MVAQQNGGRFTVSGEPAGDALQIARSRRRGNEDDQVRLRVRQRIGKSDGCQLDPHVDIGEQPGEVDRAVRVRQRKPAREGLEHSREWNAISWEVGPSAVGHMAVGPRHSANLAAQC